MLAISILATVPFQWKTKRGACNSLTKGLCLGFAFTVFQNLWQVGLALADKLHWKHQLGQQFKSLHFRECLWHFHLVLSLVGLQNTFTDNSELRNFCNCLEVTYICPEGIISEKESNTVYQCLSWKSPGSFGLLDWKWSAVLSAVVVTKMSCYTCL